MELIIPNDSNGLRGGGGVLKFGFDNLGRAATEFESRPIYKYQIFKKK